MEQLNICTVQPWQALKLTSVECGIRCSPLKLLQPLHELVPQVGVDLCSVRHAPCIQSKRGFFHRFY